MNWTRTQYGWRLIVPIITYAGQPDASYDILIERRPNYCDRGDWLIWVDGRNDIDGQDGFPRYFIGDADAVKYQMEQWLDRREAYRRQNKFVANDKFNLQETQTSTKLVTNEK